MELGGASLYSALCSQCEGSQADHTCAVPERSAETVPQYCLSSPENDRMSNTNCIAWSMHSINFGQTEKGCSEINPVLSCHSVSTFNCVTPSGTLWTLQATTWDAEQGHWIMSVVLPSIRNTSPLYTCVVQSADWCPAQFASLLTLRNLQNAYHRHLVQHAYRKAGTAFADDSQY